MRKSAALGYQVITDASECDIATFQKTIGQFVYFFLINI